MIQILHKGANQQKRCHLRHNPDGDYKLASCAAQTIILHLSGDAGVQPAGVDAVIDELWRLQQQ